MSSRLYYADWLAGCRIIETFTVAASGTILSFTSPLSRFSLQVKGTGAAATAWNVVIEGSQDGTNFQTMITHQSGQDSDGGVVWQSANQYPVLSIRVRCVSITLGGATDIVCTALGIP